MAKLEYIALALISLVAVGLYNYDVRSTNTHQDVFEEWMDMHGKHYHSDEEKNYRMGIWVKNFEEVMKHNARFVEGLETYEMGMNHFGDLFTEEFAATYLMKNVDFNDENQCKQLTQKIVGMPNAIDWTTKGAVTPVKNQGQCGSCWAFSATGSLEGAQAIKTGTLKSFSEQELVDCATAEGNHGCLGGIMEWAFTYVIKNGIVTEDAYPYTARGGTCKKGLTDKVHFTGCYDIKINDTEALKEAILVGPVSVAIQANQLGFQLYKKGVFSGNCGTKLDHGVLAVGWGTDGDKGFIKVKNSWGAGWGEQGYIRIIQKDKAGECGINMQPSRA